MLTKEERFKKVALFRKACEKADFVEVAANVFELKGPFKTTLTLCTLIHGNEIGGIEVFLRLIEDIQSKAIELRSNLRLMLGNVEAYYEDKRFLEKDMNRSFGLDMPQTKEELRAKELEKYLKSSNYFIDIHQTIGPTITPFFIFEFEKSSYDFARHLNKDIPVVTNTMDRPFKGSTSTAFAISKGCKSVTIETGQKGIEDTQISLGLEIARKAVQTNLEEELSPFSIVNTFTFTQIISNPLGDLELVKNFQNFDAVNKGELLAKNSKKEVYSEVDGVILFPKSGAYAKVSPELALILKPMKNLHSPDSAE